MHRISQVFEKGVLPFVNQLSFIKFCILTTRILDNKRSREDLLRSANDDANMDMDDNGHGNGNDTGNDDDDDDDDDDDNYHLLSTMETYQFQIMQMPVGLSASEDEDADNGSSESSCTSISTSTRTHTRRRRARSLSNQKAITIQLKSALEKVRHCTEKYSTRHGSTHNGSNDAGRTITTMNVILESRHGDSEGGGDSDGDGDIPNQTMFKKSKCTGTSSAINRMDTIQWHRRNDEPENTIIEVDHGHNEEMLLQIEDNKDLEDLEFLGQNSRSQQEILDRHRQYGVGRREIARILLPTHRLVIFRHCVLLDECENSTAYMDGGVGGNYNLNLDGLFPDHQRQVDICLLRSNEQSIEHSKIDQGIVKSRADGQKEILKNSSSPLKSMSADVKVDTISASAIANSGNKRKDSKIPLTPMKKRHWFKHNSSLPNNVCGCSEQRHNEHVFMNEACVARSAESNGGYNSLSPLRSPLLVTPKSVRNRIFSPRSGSASEAPTYVVPMSSGRKSDYSSIAPLPS